MKSESGRQGGPGGSGLLALTLVVVLLVGALASSTALVGATAVLANDGGNDTTGGNTSTDGGNAATEDRTVVDECTTLGNTGTKYRLESNLSTDSGTCLTITASDVDLDGDGFGVSGDASSSAVAVVPETSGASVGNVRVHDVRVNDSNIGVRAGKVGENVSNVTVENVTAVDNSRGGVVSFETAGLRIVDSDLRRNGAGAELLRGSATLVRVTAENNTGSGLTTALGLQAASVTGGTFADNDGHGLLVRDVAAGGTSLTNVTADGNGVHGVELESTPGATVANVTATSNTDDGLRLETNRTTVTGAVASDNGGHGFHLPGLDVADDERELRADAGTPGLVALRNGGAGARLAGSNTTVVGLNATDNTVGIDLSDATGVTVTDAAPGDGALGTTVRSSDRQGVLLSNTAGTTVEETLVQDSNAAGIRVESPADNTLQQLRVRGNAPAFVTTGSGTTSVSGLAIQNADLTLDATNVSIAGNSSGVGDGSIEPERPGNRTFGPYLDIGTIGDTTTAVVTGKVVGSVDLTVQYPDDAVEDPPLVESTARIHSYDGSWSAVDGSTNDPSANTVSATLENPTDTYSPTADLENAITSCGFTDWRSGETYRIDANLSSISGACLEVRASNATVTGFGFGGERRRLLTGDADASGLGVDVRPGQRNVTLRNLQVGNFGTGVRLGSGPGAAAANHTLERVIVNDSVGTGIVVDGDAATFRTVDVIDSGGDGIELRSSRDSSLTGLFLLGNAGSDLVLSGDTEGTTARDVELFVDPDRDDLGRAANVGFASANEVTISTITDPPAPGDGLEGITDYVDVEGQAGDAFLNLSVAYDEGQVLVHTDDESDLAMYDYNEQSGEYERVTQDAFQSEADNVIGANLTSFSTFAPLVDTSGSDGGTTTPTPTPTRTDDGDGGTPTPTPTQTDDGDSGTPTPTPTPTQTDDGDDGTATPTPTPGGGEDGDNDDDTSDEESSGGQNFAGGGGGGGGGGSADTSSPSFATRSAALNRTSMRVGGAVRIDATVENSGDQRGTYEVELFRNDNFVQSRFVELPAGEERDISFTRTPPSTGEYTYRVENVTAGTVQVVAEDEPTPTPTATPTPPSETPTDTPTVTDNGETPTRTSGGDSAPDEDQETSGPAPGSPDDGGSGLGPLGMVVGGIGALAVGAGAIYLLVLKP